MELFPTCKAIPKSRASIVLLVMAVGQALVMALIHTKNEVSILLMAEGPVCMSMYISLPA